MTSATSQSLSAYNENITTSFNAGFNGTSLSKSWSKTTGILTIVSPLVSVSGSAIYGGAWASAGSKAITATFKVYISSGVLGAKLA
jgi:hypothetical protein